MAISIDKKTKQMLHGILRPAGLLGSVLRDQSSVEAMQLIIDGKDELPQSYVDALAREVEAQRLVQGGLTQEEEEMLSSLPRSAVASPAAMTEADLSTHPVLIGGEISLEGIGAVNPDSVKALDALSIIDERRLSQQQARGLLYTLSDGGQMAELRDYLFDRIVSPSYSAPVESIVLFRSHVVELIEQLPPEQTSTRLVLERSLGQEGPLVTLSRAQALLIEDILSGASDRGRPEVRQELSLALRRDLSQKTFPADGLHFIALSDEQIAGLASIKRLEEGISLSEENIDSADVIYLDADMLSCGLISERQAYLLLKSLGIDRSDLDERASFACQQIWDELGRREQQGILIPDAEALALERALDRRDNDFFFEDSDEAYEELCSANACKRSQVRLDKETAGRLLAELNYQYSELPAYLKSISDSMAADLSDY